MYQKMCNRFHYLEVSKYLQIFSFAFIIRSEFQKFHIFIRTTLVYDIYISSLI